MADPIDEIIAGEPKPRTRKQAWANKGIPKDPHKAHQRIRASRKTRTKRVGNAALSGTFPAPLVQAVEAISDRYNVSRQAVMKRMLEDGIRKYGNDDELSLANFPKHTPFDEFQPIDTQADTYHAQHVWPDNDTTRAIVDSPYLPRKAPFPMVPSAGAPVSYETVIQGDVLDEAVDID
jgi:hypothetical protein